MIPATEPETAPSTWPARIAAGASIAVHVAAVAFFLGYAGAGAYESEPEAVAVSVVTAAEAAKEVAKEATAPPEEKIDLRPSLDSERLLQPAPSPQPLQQSAPSQQAQGSATPPTARQKTAATSPPPYYTPPPPDISLQYGVDLGLKEFALAAAASDEPRKGTSDFDAAATEKAELDKSSIAAFRSRLRECAALPPQITLDDKVVIVMRATFTPDARLAGEPTLIEATASPSKGLALMQAAVKALQTCQPHNTLPADKYSEWRALDLRFTPQDFRRG